MMKMINYLLSELFNYDSNTKLLIWMSYCKVHTNLQEHVLDLGLSLSSTFACCHLLCLCVWIVDAYYNLSKISCSHNIHIALTYHYFSVFSNVIYTNTHSWKYNYTLRNESMTFLVLCMIHFLYLIVFKIPIITLRVVIYLICFLSLTTKYFGALM